MRNLIKVQRAMHDLTQAELSEKVGVSRQTINSVEIGKYIPSTVLAFKIATILYTTVDELFSLDDKDWK